MDAATIRAMNEGFMSKLGSPELREKLAAEGSSYIQLMVREQSFADRALEPTPIQLSDLERNLEQMTLHKIEEVEPDSFAMVGAPVGFGSRQPITARFVGLPIITFQTPLFTYTRDELDVFKTPVLKIMDENLVKDLGDQIDAKFVDLLEGSLDWLDGIVANYHKTTHTIAPTTPFTKDVFLKGLDKLRDPNGRRYSGARFLLNATTYDLFRGLTADHVSEAILDKFLLTDGALENFMGHQFIVTGKNDLIADGVIYYLANKNAEVNQFGSAYSYRDAEFTVETYHNKNFEFMARMQRMMGILNGYGVAKLTIS